MRLTGRALIASLAAFGFVACSSSTDNPFAGAFRTRVPPTSCRLLFVSNLYASAADAPPELYCASLSGAPPERLTYCNTPDASCAILEAAPAPTRERAAVRRVATDTNGDGHLTDADGAALVFLDLARGVQSELAPSTLFVSGVDWSPTFEVLAYSAAGAAGREDLFRRGVSSSDTADSNITSTAEISERRPRFERTGSLVVYERIDADGKGTVWLFSTVSLQEQLTHGAPGSAKLAGTPYVIGADADPTVSPDNQWVVFRRLTGVGSANGDWDILKIEGSGTQSPVPIVTGAGYRGAPDWGNDGIAFSESDPVSGGTTLVVVDADGGNRRVVASVPTGFALRFPRWLPSGG